MSCFLFDITNDDRRALLWYCLGFAMYAGMSPIDKYIKNILDEGRGGYCGGDPGWEIDAFDDEGNVLLDESGRRVFRVWADPDISKIEPDTEYYLFDEVKEYVRQALVCMRERMPESRVEVARILNRYWG